MSATSPIARCAALSRVSYMIGKWAGDGQFRNATGSHHFTQTETVNVHLDGELLTVEGIGRDRDDPTRRIHAALAVLSYDAERDRYQWRAYSAGQWTDTELRLDAHGFRWTLNVAPRMVIRYTALFADDIWDEISEISQDGEPWSPLMSMRLHRQG